MKLMKNRARSVGNDVQQGSDFLLAVLKIVMLSLFARLPEAAARRELAKIGGGAEVRGSACRSRKN